MKFLGIGEYNDLGAMYFGLLQRGHEVRVFIESESSRDVFGGMVHLVTDWRSEFDWIRSAGDQGIVIFESAIKGNVQDELRRSGLQVIGGSALGDRLESDRNFGQQLLANAGLHTARSHRFDDYDDAIRFLQENGGRYVLKHNGADTLRTSNYVGQLDDSQDMIAMLTLEKKDARAHCADFVLMEFIKGVEVGVGAYFNGDIFMKPACIDFEHKKFFAGEMGELTGEMGTIVSYEGAERLFDATLAKVEDELRNSGYCGYINLNLMVNEQGLWPIEFTSRFGYPGFAICEALHEEPWEDIFVRALRKDGDRIKTRHGFAAGVVLTVPPFPYKEGYEQLSKGAPICFRPDTTAADMAALHFAEVAMSDGHLVTSGCGGYIGVATGLGASVQQAREEAYRVASKVVIPNLRYRNDIGSRVIEHELASLVRLGWFDEALARSTIEG